MKFLLRFKYIIDRKYTTFYYFICLVLVLKNIGYFNFDICLFFFLKLKDSIISKKLIYEKKNNVNQNK